MSELPHVDSFDPEDGGSLAPPSKSENSGATDAAHEEARPVEPVELDISEPNFMADAYDTYADLRAKGPVSRVRFAGGEEEESGDGEEQPGRLLQRARHTSSPITTRSSLPCSTTASRSIPARG